MTNEVNFDEMEPKTSTFVPQAETQMETAQTKQVMPTNSLSKLPNVEAADSGMLVGKNLDEQFRLAKALCASRLLPKQYDTPEKVFAGMQLCYELGLKPMTGLKNIAVIGGSPVLFGDGPLAIVNKSGVLKMIDETTYDETGKKICVENLNLNAAPYAAGCTVQRQGYEPVTRMFTMEQAKKAGLLSNPTWTKFTSRMLQLRARSHALKDTFPDVLLGLPIAEYSLNVSPENETIKDVSPETSVDDLNEKFGS